MGIEGLELAGWKRMIPVAVMWCRGCKMEVLFRVGRRKVECWRERRCPNCGVEAVKWRDSYRSPGLEGIIIVEGHEVVPEGVRETEGGER